jgi:hypothetical protein
VRSILFSLGAYATAAFRDFDLSGDREGPGQNAWRAYRGNAGHLTRVSELGHSRNGARARRDRPGESRQSGRYRRLPYLVLKPFARSARWNVAATKRLPHRQHNATLNLAIISGSAIVWDATKKRGTRGF